MSAETKVAEYESLAKAFGATSPEELIGRRLRFKCELPGHPSHAEYLNKERTLVIFSATIVGVEAREDLNELDEPIESICFELSKKCCGYGDWPIEEIIYSLPKSTWFIHLTGYNDEHENALVAITGEGTIYP